MRDVYKRQVPAYKRYRLSVNFLRRFRRPVFGKLHRQLVQQHPAIGVRVKACLLYTSIGRAREDVEKEAEVMKDETER